MLQLLEKACQSSYLIIIHARAHSTAQRVLAVSAYPRWESVQLAQAARRVVLSIGAATLRSCSVLRGGRPVPAALTVLGPSKQRDAT